MCAIPNGEHSAFVSFCNSNTICIHDSLSLLSDAAYKVESVWWYYPWLRCFVHLPNRDNFFHLRTARNRNKISEAEQLQLRSKTIGVIGLSVGHASALALAREGLCSHLKLADFDTLEWTNLNRLSASVSELGLPKTTLAARHLSEIDPYLSVDIFETGINEANIAEFLNSPRLDLVVEECDDLAMKLHIRQAARRARIPVLMDTNDKGLLDIERYDLQPDYPILHGLFSDIDATSLASMNAQEKYALFCRFFGGEDHMSDRLRLSMSQIGISLSGVPQLCSDVLLGAALVAHAARGIFLAKLQQSGRYSIDLESLIR